MHREGAMKEVKKERRIYPRCSAGERVSFKIYNGESRASQLSDLSWSGMCLREVPQLEGLSWLQAQRLRHKPVTVTFEGQGLVARGTIARVNTKQHQLGLRISSTSNDMEWKRHCHT